MAIFDAELPIERVGELIAQHIRGDMEKIIRQQLTDVISPLISKMAKDYAAQVCQDCKVATAEDIATGRLHITVKLSGE